MPFYRDFITESLALYAANVVYRYGLGYSSSYIKSELKSQAALSRYTISFYNTGYYYRYGGYFNQTWWQLHAQGYYFAGGYTSSYYSKLTKLIDLFRFYSQSSGSYRLLSTNFYTAQAYFEKCFYLAYGKYANAGWIYASTSGYKNTRYLYGDFWYKWYN